MTNLIDQTKPSQPSIEFIRLPQVLKIMGISKTPWYEGIKIGLYPKGTKVTGKRATRWDLNDIQALAAKLK